MKPNRSKYKICPLAIVIAFVSLSFSQTGLSQEIERPPLIPKRTQPKTYVKIKKKGWKLAGLDNNDFLGRSELKKVGDGSATLYITALKPADGGALVLDAPSPILSKIVTRYDVDGKVFCYFYSGTCVGPYKQENGEKTYIFMGCRTSYAYYDEDGDGIFEKIENFAPGFFEVHIPEYLLKVKGK